VTAFAALHRPGSCLLLPNVWDVAGARALAAAGFPAVGTTSLGVAASAGLPDGHDETAAETLRLVRHLVLRLTDPAPALLISADLERGTVPTAVAAAEAGAAGINVEDAMTDPQTHARLIRAIKREAPHLFVNARTDTHWLRTGTLAEATARTHRYQDAGADGVFVPGLSDLDGIATLASSLDVPLNVLYHPAGPPLPALAAAGARRVSLGSLPFRAALAATVDIATRVRAGTPIRRDLPTYDEVNIPAP
jgi:2-methylisocitrate lyase-like PEP mutase family enzyme